MKICYTVFLCLIFQFCFGQINDFEGLSNHEDYSSYRQVVFKSFMGSTTEYNLKESRVTDLIFYFSKDNIVRKESFIYDTIGNLISVNNYNIANNELYVGSEIIDDEDWRTMTSFVREFVNYDIRDIVYTELDSDFKVKDYNSPLVPPIIVSYQTFNQNWESQLITIVESDWNRQYIPIYFKGGVNGK